MKVVFTHALVAGLFVSLQISSAKGRIVSYIGGETVFCETLGNAIIARETRGRMPLPQGCISLPKGRWTGIVLIEGDRHYYVAVPLKDGQHAKGWVSTDQVTSITDDQAAAIQKSLDRPATQPPANAWSNEFQRQVVQCWKKPDGGSKAERSAKFSIKFKYDGALEHEPQSTSAPTSTFHGMYQESLKRAITACQPYKLPDNAFEEWKSFVITFFE